MTTNDWTDLFCSQYCIQLDICIDDIWKANCTNWQVIIPFTGTQFLESRAIQSIINTAAFAIYLSVSGWLNSDKC